MSNIEKNIVILVANEVAINFDLRELPQTSAEKLLAIFSSYPTSMITTEKVAEGSYWNGKTFKAPVE
jgi:hypothetical protein